MIESAPQSTITHNAVIEFASDFLFHPAPSPRSRRTHKKEAFPAQRAASNRRDHAKIATPAQRRGGQKPSNFERNHWYWRRANFALDGGRGLSRPKNTRTRPIPSGSSGLTSHSSTSVKRPFRGLGERQV